MARRRVRLTIGRLMVAIALVALVLGGGLYARRLQQRSRLYRSMASQHALWAKGYRAEADRGWSDLEAARKALGRRLDIFRESGSSYHRVRQIVLIREKAFHHARLAAVYRRASTRPWLGIEPDPPAPSEEEFDAHLVAAVIAFEASDTLDLGQTGVRDEALSALASASRIRRLNLARTRITDVGLAHLASLTNLEELILDGTAVTDAAVNHLKHLTKLKILDIYQTHITQPGVRALGRALPDCTITHDPF